MDRWTLTRRGISRGLGWNETQETHNKVLFLHPQLAGHHPPLKGVRIAVHSNPAVAAVAAVAAAFVDAVAFGAVAVAQAVAAAHAVAAGPDCAAAHNAQWSMTRFAVPAALARFSVVLLLPAATLLGPLRASRSGAVLLAYAAAAAPACPVAELETPAAAP